MEIAEGSEFIRSESIQIALGDAFCATPCSVKTNGIADFGRLPPNVITNCDDIVSHSLLVSLNMYPDNHYFRFQVQTLVVSK